LLNTLEALTSDEQTAVEVGILDGEITDNN
jgi:hypothetical protein